MRTNDDTDDLSVFVGVPEMNALDCTPEVTGNCENRTELSTIELGAGVLADLIAVFKLFSKFTLKYLLSLKATFYDHYCLRTAWQLLK